MSPTTELPRSSSNHGKLLQATSNDGSPKSPKSPRSPRSPRSPFGGVAKSPRTRSGSTGVEKSSSSGGEGGGGRSSRRAGSETVKQAVISALRKELLVMWVDSAPDLLDIALLERAAKLLAPSLLQDLIAVGAKRLPHILKGISGNSLLPEVAARSLQGCGTPSCHAELFDEFRAFLGSHDLLSTDQEASAALQRDISANLHADHPWRRRFCRDASLLLPMGAVQGLCESLAPILLSAGIAANGLDGAAFTPAMMEDDDEAEASPQTGSPTTLTVSRRYRRRIFALERELVAREAAEKNRLDREIQGRDQVNQRLMEVNRHLEDKLKQRNEEVRRLQVQLVELQRTLEDTQTQLSERESQVLKLEYRLEQELACRRETSTKEQEHARALLRASARQVSFRQQNLKRIQLLERCLQGSGAPEIAELLKVAAEPDFDASPEPSELLLDNLEQEFRRKTKQRDEQQEAALQAYQAKLDEKKREYSRVCGTPTTT